MKNEQDIQIYNGFFDMVINNLSDDVINGEYCRRNIESSMQEGLFFKN